MIFFFMVFHIPLRETNIFLCNKNNWYIECKYQKSQKSDHSLYHKVENFPTRDLYLK